MSGLHFRRAGHGTIYLVESVVDRLSRYRQTRPGDREAGGLLLGRHLLDCHDIIVDEITEPRSSDRRSWAGFFRSVAHHAIARRRWKQRAERCAYLGSWHSHPESIPTPSSTDHADWRQALVADSYEGDSLCFLIVGTAALRIWEGRQDCDFVELQLTRSNANGDTKD